MKKLNQCSLNKSGDLENKGVEDDLAGSKRASNILAQEGCKCLGLMLLK